MIANLLKLWALGAFAFLVFFGTQVTKAEEAFQAREFSPMLDEQWIGQGISYGPYREGQAPGGKQPSREQLTEDFKLLVQHWNLIRVYGSGETTASMLQVIRDEKLPIKVMVGAWITSETESDKLDSEATKQAKAANQMQVDGAIQLANEYPDQVLSLIHI